jgi:methylated-DNA-[protein]-cysteine S-methyltransferase
MPYSMHCHSPLGTLFLASDGDALTGLWMEGQKYFGGAAAEEFAGKDRLPVFTASRKWLDSYFKGKRPSAADLPLAPGGSDFRRAVWNLLREIPYGEYTTYGALAKKMAALTDKDSMSGQAIGGAVGHNPISIIIPCHRVVGANGSLAGYAGGIDKKTRLLRHEGVDVSRFFVPKKGTAL